MTAPIVLFVYARPDHARRTVESLLKNPESSESHLIIFSDASRSTEKVDAVKQVRDYVESIKGFRSITIHHRANNFGLVKSIIEGVTQVLSTHDRVIVLEDDMETSSHFLRYMNEALDRFANDERVISIHGYMYPVKIQLPEAIFLRGADCWGWATWQRGWDHFNPDGQYLLAELKRKKLLKAFDLNGAYGYSKMLANQIKGRNDSWAVRWHASAFLANKLTLYPGRSLVLNIGNDSSGTHCERSDVLDVELSDTPICLDDVVVEESALAQRTLGEFFRPKRSIFQRIMVPFMSTDIHQQLRGIAIDWLPPALARLLRLLLRRMGFGRIGITLEGPFSSWSEAKQRSTGYDSDHILQKVLAATLKVKSGEAVFERDSVLFEEIQYAWPITAGLMWVAARNGGRLSVLDYGGSLGSIYFQNTKFFKGLEALHWSIVEQPHFVEAGRKHIQNEQLDFYRTIAECIAKEQPNAILLSSVLQYLEKPYEVLDELIKCGIDSVIVDRTPFLISGSQDMFMTQITPNTIYNANYPIRYFSYNKFMSWFKDHGFKVVESFQSLEKLDTIAEWRGMILWKNDK